MHARRKSVKLFCHLKETKTEAAGRLFLSKSAAEEVIKRDIILVYTNYHHGLIN